MKTTQRKYVSDFYVWRKGHKGVKLFLGNSMQKSTHFTFTEMANSINY